MHLDPASALLSMQRAMLSMISPNLRGIRIEEKNESFGIYFYYENTPSEEEEMASFMVAEFISDFPDKETDFEIIALPITEKIPKKEVAVYLRYGELGPVQLFFC